MIEKENHPQGKPPQQSIALLLRAESQPGFGRGQTMKSFVCHSEELYPTRMQKQYNMTKFVSELSFSSVSRID